MKTDSKAIMDQTSAINERLQEMGLQKKTGSMQRLVNEILESLDPKNMMPSTVGLCEIAIRRTAERVERETLERFKVFGTDECATLDCGDKITLFYKSLRCIECQNKQKNRESPQGCGACSSVAVEHDARCKRDSQS
jgi:hypothetical protein